MSEPILEIQNLHVNFETYGQTAEVINGIDLSINQGDTVGLVGETGCGKSVTSKAILGLLSPNASVPAGEIRYRGENLLELSDTERHSKRGSAMTMIMQDPMTALNPVFTVGEQMVDVLKWQGLRKLPFHRWLMDKIQYNKNTELREQAINMLADVEIPDPERVFDSYPVELSGGMRQRVVIALALLSEPDLLIADEPGTALDVTTEAKILRLLSDLAEQQDMSVLYITHDLGVAKKVTSQINVMYAGEIVESSPTEELFKNPQHPYTRGLLDSVPQLSTGMGDGIDGSIPDYTDPPKACRFADRCPHAESDCYTVYPYRRTTGKKHSVACHLFDGPPTYDRHADYANTVVDVAPDDQYQKGTTWLTTDEDQEVS
ncbi:ABC transporter ATP-binding protein [Natrialbaceae archaeon A-CW2]